jgi:hypothetical protein
MSFMPIHCTHIRNHYSQQCRSPIRWQKKSDSAEYSKEKSLLLSIRPLAVASAPAARWQPKFVQKFAPISVKWHPIILWRATWLFDDKEVIHFQKSCFLCLMAYRFDDLKS